VLNVVSSFISLVLNYLEKNNTHFINTHSPSSQRNVSYVMAVSNISMASPIVVVTCGAVMNLMFNVVWSLTSLPTLVMNTNLFSLAYNLNIIAVVVVLKFPQYSAVPLVTLLWTSNALHYHIPQVTNNMSIPSLSVILLRMTLVNTIVIYVKKNETQSIGSTIVKIAVILLIPNVFLGNTQIASFELLTNFTFIHTPLLSLRKLKITLYVTNVAVLAKSWSINVPNVISTATIIV
jgi:hypothetical protein